MKKPLISLAVCAALLVVSLGLCGISGNFQDIPKSNLNTAGLLGFIAAVLGMGASLLWLLIAAVRQGQKR